jgi:hypothetical protein
MQRLSLRPAIKASPQAPARIRPELEIPIEREFDSVGSCNNGRFFQPNAMLRAVQMEHGMPAVGALPHLTVAQVTKVEADMRMRGCEQRRSHRNHRDQGFGRPEDCLF